MYYALWSITTILQTVKLRLGNEVACPRSHIKQEDGTQAPGWVQVAACLLQAFLALGTQPDSNAGHPDHLPAYLRRALFQDSSGLIHLTLSACTRPGTELALWSTMELIMQEIDPLGLGISMSLGEPRWQNKQRGWFLKPLPNAAILDSRLNKTNKKGNFGSLQGCCL